MTENERYHDIEKPNGEVLRISKSTYNGHEFCTVRIWFEGKKGDLLPTRRGVTFKPSDLPEIIQALQQLQREAG